MEVNPIFSDFNTPPIQTKQSTIPPRKNNVEKNKKALIIGVSVLATMGAAGIMIAKGKTNKAQKTIKETTPKKINNLAKKLAESNIKFDKGIAKQGDNLFSGRIEETLNSGKKVILDYKDGKIQQSTIGDITKKYTYKDLHKRIDIFGPENIKHDILGNKIGETGYWYDANGKLKKISRFNDGLIGQNTKEFKNGKLIGEAKFLYGSGIERGAIYALDGKVLKSFTHDTITEFAQDGSLKIKKGKFEFPESNIFSEMFGTPLNELDMKSPKEIIWKDKNGKEIAKYTKYIYQGKKTHNFYKDGDSLGSIQEATETANGIYHLYSERLPIDFDKNGKLTINKAEIEEITTKYNLSFNLENQKKGFENFLKILENEKIDFSDNIKEAYEQLLKLK